MNILVVVEHNGTVMSTATRSALTFADQLAQEVEGEVKSLVMGAAIQGVVQETSCYSPVLVAEGDELKFPVADRYAVVIEKCVRDYNIEFVVAASTTFSKDVVARAAGLLGGAMASDVVGHNLQEGKLRFRRPMYAGSIIATVELEGSPQVVTVRATSYPPATPKEQTCEVSTISGATGALPDHIEYLALESKLSHRPDVAEARIVVSGGRALKNTEDFEEIVGGLADRLGAATGSSRALVDAGITPNEMQVGQTGKIVAPDVYIALGISGAVQHLAGMKNSGIIVSINSDPHAPIFEVSDYGIVGDVYTLVPEMMDRLNAR